MQSVQASNKQERVTRLVNLYKGLLLDELARDTSLMTMLRRQHSFDIPGGWLDKNLKGEDRGEIFSAAAEKFAQWFKSMFGTSIHVGIYNMTEFEEFTLDTWFITLSRRRKLFRFLQ